jgi:ribonucleotide monophosphatase NagD (HAD superfamily)
VSELFSHDDNFITFEVAVSFVVGEMEFIEFISKLNRQAFGDFSPIMDGLVVRESEFAKVHKCEETCQYHSKEKPIIVLVGRRIVVDDSAEVIKCKGAFSFRGCASHAFAST